MIVVIEKVRDKCMSPNCTKISEYPPNLIFWFISSHFPVHYSSFSPLILLFLSSSPSCSVCKSPFLTSFCFVLYILNPRIHLFLDTKLEPVVIMQGLIKRINTRIFTYSILQYLKPPTSICLSFVREIYGITWFFSSNNHAFLLFPLLLLFIPVGCVYC